jgi:exopolysaccharide biosynthesis polyprenyl glycosylphosphotransferase
MLRQNLPIFRRIHLVVDLGLTLFSYHLALLIRGGLSDLPGFSPLEAARPYSPLPFILPVWAFFLFFNHESYEYRGKPFGEVLKHTGLVIVESFAVLLVLLFFTRSLDQSRSQILIFLILNFLFLLSFRKLVSDILSYFRKKGYNFKNVLIVGTGSPARDFIGDVKENPHWGYRILGILDWEDGLKGERVGGVPVIGNLSDLSGILKNHHVDYVIFAVCKRFLSLVEESVLLCEEMGVPTCVLADFFPLRYSKTRIGKFQRKPALLFSSAPEANGLLALKSTLDRLVSLVGVAFLSPVLLALSLLVKFTSPGPVFFKQQRCGLNGKRFTMLKFRTMVENADQMKDALSDQNEMDGPAFKMTDDPRLTGVGKMLRKFSLDELPQLINVLSGQMSLVGPRPPLPQEVSQYDLWQRRRLAMKPGLTCLWQVNGRNNVNFERWMRMDLEYIDNWSLWLDAKILLKTIPAVVSGTGAK